LCVNEYLTDFFSLINTLFVVGVDSKMDKHFVEYGVYLRCHVEGLNAAFL